MYQPKDYYILRAESNYDRMKRRRKYLKIVVNMLLWIAIISFVAGSISVIVTGYK